MPQPRRADIRALVRRLQRGSTAERMQAALDLGHMAERNAGSADAILAAVTTSGGIPALVQLIASHGEHPGAAQAAALLAESTSDSDAHCRSIIAAGGIAPLVGCLESSLPALQAASALALANITAWQGEAAWAAVAAAGAIPAATGLLSSSSDELVLMNAASLLRNMAQGHEYRRPIAAAAGIPPLVRLLRHWSPAVVAEAASVLSNLVAGDQASIVTEVQEAGALPLLVGLLATESHEAVIHMAGMCAANMLKSCAALTAPAVIAAGGIPALLRCLRGRRFAQAHEWAAFSLGVLADTGAEHSQAIADAGGIRALLQLLAWPCSEQAKIPTAFAFLLLNRQAAAVAAADPTDAATSLLEWLPGCPIFANTTNQRADLSDALGLLAAARRSMPAASTAAAPAAQAAPSPATRPEPSTAAADEPPASPRVCAAPGCGATRSLKRCAGCGSVRYCGEACMRAHWKVHRPECKRLRAAAGSGGAGPSGQP